MVFYFFYFLFGACIILLPSTNLYSDLINYKKKLYKFSFSKTMKIYYFLKILAFFIILSSLFPFTLIFVISNFFYKYTNNFLWEKLNFFSLKLISFFLYPFTFFLYFFEKKFYSSKKISELVKGKEHFYLVKKYFNGNVIYFDYDTKLIHRYYKPAMFSVDEELSPYFSFKNKSFYYMGKLVKKVPNNSDNKSAFFNEDLACSEEEYDLFSLKNKIEDF